LKAQASDSFVSMINQMLYASLRAFPILHEHSVCTKSSDGSIERHDGNSAILESLQLADISSRTYEDQSRDAMTADGLKLLIFN